MSVDVNILKSINIFEGICSINLQKLSSLMYPIKVAEEEVLTRKGNPAHSFYIILSGNFMVHFNEGRAITLHNRGDIIGWSSIVTPFRYKGSSVALSEGEVLSIPSRKFQGLIQENSELADKLIKRINAVILDRFYFMTGHKLSSEEPASGLSSAA